MKGTKLISPPRSGEKESNEGQIERRTRGGGAIPHKAIRKCREAKRRQREKEEQSRESDFSRRK